MNKWIAEFELEDGDSMPEHMDLNFMGARLDFHCKPVSDCIPIPKDATNGDVIKAMFPNAEPIERYTGSMLIKTMSIKTWQPFFAMFDADVDWWNAPYKVEREE